eukprot:5127641-Pyramimonas_sp.AAC.1
MRLRAYSGPTQGLLGLHDSSYLQRLCQEGFLLCCSLRQGRARAMASTPPAGGAAFSEASASKTARKAPSPAGMHPMGPGP